MLNQIGFLLSSLKYGDYDGILHCFTKEIGYQSFFIKGLFSSKNKNKAYILPLNELCLTVGKKPNNSGRMHNVAKIEAVENLNFYTNIKCANISFFIADFLNIILQNESKQERIYQEILFLINELEQNNYRSHLIFMLKVLQIQGLAPLISTSDFLNVELGEFSSKQTHKLFPADISSIWKTILTANIPYSTNIKQPLRQPFLESILAYYHYHYPNFRTPHSLEILREIFS